MHNNIENLINSYPENKSDILTAQKTIEDKRVFDTTKGFYITEENFTLDINYSQNRAKDFMFIYALKAPRLICRNISY